MKKITFYFNNNMKLSITTNKTNEEIRKMFDFNWFYNVDPKNNMTCINLREVIYVDVDSFKSEVE